VSNRPTAIVMNMFYTGLGIARSLGERRIPVVGLSAHRGIYGNFTRYAQVRRSPDSREAPDKLLEFLLELGKELGGRNIIFPTRDDDVLFLDRYRTELSENFIPVIPPEQALNACLDKWQTYLCAQRSAVPVPRSWKIESEEDVLHAARELRFPCVLKPISSHSWRKEANWNHVGCRKAIGIVSMDRLLEEYTRVAAVDRRVLLQEMVPGPDDQLMVAACFVDRASGFFAGFTVQKLAQEPEGFGTGCIVKTADFPELLRPTARLLMQMGFSGIAEVEYKRDPCGEYKLIEVNPRPWDQHRLGHCCGVDLVYLAYCHYAGLALPAMEQQSEEHKWIAEDVLAMAFLRSLSRRDGRFRQLWKLAWGQRIYGIWSADDPFPLIAYVLSRFSITVAGAIFSRLGSVLRRRVSRILPREVKKVLYERKV